MKRVQIHEEYTNSTDMDHPVLPWAAALLATPVHVHLHIGEIEWSSTPFMLKCSTANSELQLIFRYFYGSASWLFSFFFYEMSWTTAAHFHSHCGNSITSWTAPNKWSVRIFQRPLRFCARSGTPSELHSPRNCSSSPRRVRLIAAIVYFRAQPKTSSLLSAPGLASLITESLFSLHTFFAFVRFALAFPSLLL